MTNQTSQLYPFIYREHQRRAACKEVLNGVTFDDDDEPVLPSKKPRTDEDITEESSETLNNATTSLHNTLYESEEPQEPQKEENTEESQILPTVEQKHAEQAESSKSEVPKTSTNVQKTKITDFFKRKIVKNIEENKE